MLTKPTNVESIITKNSLNSHSLPGAQQAKQYLLVCHQYVYIMSSASASEYDSDGASASSSTKTSTSTSSTSTATNETTPHHQVQLAIYDLSQGMAKALSAQLLGPDHAIDMVPHTGLLVFGKEYFFASGTGVAVEAPEVFRTTRNLAPRQILEVGTTEVTPSDFDEWCRRQSQSMDAPFHASRYNLFDQNCNHFSQQALKDGLRVVPNKDTQNGELIPQWILDIPQKFLASPFGQLARPMLENMQVSGGVPFAPTALTATTTTDIAANDTTQQKNPNTDNASGNDVRLENPTKKQNLHPRQEEQPDNNAPPKHPTTTANTITDPSESDDSSSQQPTLKVAKLSHHTVTQ